MKLYYLSIDAQFNNIEEMLSMEQKYNLVIANITKFEIQSCHSDGELYYGPNVYMFIGKWEDIVNYLVNGYLMNDVDELQETLKLIRPMDLN